MIIDTSDVMPGDIIRYQGYVPGPWLVIANYKLDEGPSVLVTHIVFNHDQGLKEFKFFIGADVDLVHRGVT